MVHIDETSHPRNDESSLRWCWLASSDDLVYEKILYSRSSHSAKLILGDEYSGVVISDQCPSYNWIPEGQRQLCWSHIKLNETCSKSLITVAEVLPPELAGI